jgi:hypothetical protein
LLVNYPVIFGVKNVLISHRSINAVLRPAAFGVNRSANDSVGIAIDGPVKAVSEYETPRTGIADYRD